MTPRMVSWAHCIAAKEQRSLHSYHGFLWNPDEWNNKCVVGKEKYVAIVSTVVETASAADTLAVFVQASPLHLARSREGDRAGTEVAGADSAQVQLLEILYSRSFWNCLILCVVPAMYNRRIVQR